MAVKRSELLNRELTTLDEAKQWVRDLVELDLLFHFEDDPSDIGNSVGGKWVNTFTKTEAFAVARRQQELYSFKWGRKYECPIGFALSLTKDK